MDSEHIRWDTSPYVSTFSNAGVPRAPCRLSRLQQQQQNGHQHQRQQQQKRQCVVTVATPVQQLRLLLLSFQLSFLPHNRPHMLLERQL
jgi:hypothetical protein